ncbi:hypothetical protein V9K67_17125 [Paraflavisolibacter sp. H34]|uniref:hypothetical protein n=1 Tax=Huijunlia imazamoxiresistens TaxID=3127457 RepID=UPI00301AAF03
MKCETLSFPFLSFFLFWLFQLAAPPAHGQEHSPEAREWLRQRYQAARPQELSFDSFARRHRHLSPPANRQQAAAAAASILDCKATHVACANGDFESGTIEPTRWRGAFGTWFSGEPKPTAMTEGFIPGPIDFSFAHQTLVTAGKDPVVPAISQVAPGGGKYSLRLGNRANGAGTEMIAKTFTVTAAQTVFAFQYALVFQDPGHTPADQPAFSVRAFDCATGQELQGICDLGNGSNKAVSDADDPFFASIPRDSIAYKNWTQAQVNLSAHIGKKVTLVFTNKDCGQSGHFGYTYLDNFCTACTIGCRYSLTLDRGATSACGKGKICLNYALPRAGTVSGTLVLKLAVYQGGKQVGAALSSPALSSGTSYCFTVDPATLGLNRALEGFDYVVTGLFTLRGYNLSPIIVGQIPEGQAPGRNNDYRTACVCTVRAVCKNVRLNLVRGLATLKAADVDGGSSATCGIRSMSVTPASFTCSQVGNHKVRLTVTANDGKTASCDATVTVTGSTPACTGIRVLPANNTYTGGVPTNIYLGYGPQSVTLSPVVSGAAPFTYSWTPATGLSSATAAQPVFTPRSGGVYTFTVRVANAFGCATTCRIQICVVDIRDAASGSGRVYLCHQQPGTSLKRTVSVTPAEAAAHLSAHPGDRLGSCTSLPCSSPPPTVGPQYTFLDRKAPPGIRLWRP